MSTAPLLARTLICASTHTDADNSRHRRLNKTPNTICGQFPSRKRPVRGSELCAGGAVTDGRDRPIERPHKAHSGRSKSTVSTGIVLRRTRPLRANTTPRSGQHGPPAIRRHLTRLRFHTGQVERARAGRQAAASVRHTAANTRQQATCAVRAANASAAELCTQLSASRQPRGGHLQPRLGAADTILIGGGSCSAVSTAVADYTPAPALDSTRSNMINGHRSLRINNAARRRHRRSQRSSLDPRRSQAPRLPKQLPKRLQP
uniref:Uncharacterized protein n=1 Tax=Plectus sambesii TaxID=2011161 RepID=A0A914V934_9BILA